MHVDFCFGLLRHLAVGGVERVPHGERAPATAEHRLYTVVVAGVEANEPTAAGAQ